MNEIKKELAIIGLQNGLSVSQVASFYQWVMQDDNRTYSYLNKYDIKSVTNRLHPCPQNVNIALRKYGVRSVGDLVRLGGVTLGEERGIGRKIISNISVILEEVFGIKCWAHLGKTSQL